MSMSFCGQCGQQLAPGSTRCPHCGTMVEPADVATSGDLHMNDATVASRAFIVKNSPPPQTPQSQQPLILRGSGDYGYGTQGASEATSRVEQVQYNTQAPPSQAPGNSYAGYPAQSGGGYSPLPGSYPVQNTGSYPPQVPPNYQPGSLYTEVPPGGSYPQYSSQPLFQRRSINAKGRTTGLILVLIGLLLIIGAAVLFAMQQGLIGGIKVGVSGYGEGTVVAVVNSISTLLSTISLLL